jgi:mannose-6-phosphate isomerase-like protein (cupin superfamily)
MSGAAKIPRRIVTIDDVGGKSTAIADGPVPDVLFDTARPGFSSARVWVTAATPVEIARVADALKLQATAQGLLPPPRGSVCRIVTFPPDEISRGKVGAAEIAAHFHAVGSPDASTYSAKAPHPYMQRTRTLDFCLVLDGEITLVLDTEEVFLSAGDTVVQRGTNHAWSNRSSRPCTIAISSHDAME